MLNKLTKFIVILLMIIGALGVRTFDIHGEDDGSITIDLIHQEDKDGTRIDTPIPGIEFDVYHVWQYQFSKNDDKEEIDILLHNSFNNIVTITSDMSEDEIQKKVSLFVENIDDVDPIMTTVPSDKDGRIVVSGLELGGYLFVMKETIEYDGYLYQVSPFLVSIPRNIENNWLYDVNAFPKLEIIKDEPPLDKKINGSDEFRLKVNYEEFTYTIETVMPRMAEVFEIYDTMEPVLEFRPYESLDELIEVTIGSKKLSLEELKNQVKIEGQKLTVMFTRQQLRDYKRQPVSITFGARIRKGADLSKYIDKKVPNECEYKLNNIYKKKDAVYVLPPSPPWNPPKTGIYIVDVVVGDPWYFTGFLLITTSFVLMLSRRNRKQKA